MAHRMYRIPRARFFLPPPDRAPSAFLCASAFNDNQLIHEKVSAKPTVKFHVVVDYRYRLLN